jgi:hypothetical protein
MEYSLINFKALEKQYTEIDLSLYKCEVKQIEMFNYYVIDFEYSVGQEFFIQDQFKVKCTDNIKKALLNKISQVKREYL